MTTKAKDPGTKTRRCFVCGSTTTIRRGFLGAVSVVATKGSGCLWCAPRKAR